METKLFRWVDMFTEFYKKCFIGSTILLDQVFNQRMTGVTTFSLL